MIQNIPYELQVLPQWVASGSNKVPINPRTGQPASSTDPTTWGTFEEAVRCGLANIGFVLSPADPYCIIDLDDPFRRRDATKSRINPGDPDYDKACLDAERNRRLLELFPDTYCELSQSGQGYHIITRGHIPKNVRRDAVEMYSQDHYLICTGNVHRQAPIIDQQDLVDDLFRLMDTDDGERLAHLETIASVLSDEQVIEMAMGAANAEKFNMLCAGRWQEMGLYESQSEADLALCTILAYYTRDDEQVIRLFRYSGLGQREKAQRDEYFRGKYGMLNRIRAKQPQLVDMSALLPAPGQLANEPAHEEVLPEQPVVAHVPPAYAQQPTAAPTGEPQYPPGFVGEVAKFIYRYAVMPNHTYSIAGAIALTAGIVGRSYNINGLGLNQYLIAVGGTGTGKDGISQGIEALVSAARLKGSAQIDQFIGPAEFASGQGLLKTFGEQMCFVSMLGEIGLTLQQISSPRANSAEKQTLKTLLDLYSKSGWHQTVRARVYSNKENNTKILQAPALTIIGEGNPEDFFGALSEEQIKQGLIPRFHVVEHEGEAPEFNDHSHQPPPDYLAQQVCDLVNIALNTQMNQRCAPVSSDGEGKRILDEYRLFQQSQMKGGEAIKQIWNRAHVKALKLAGLLAVGLNPHAPTINAQCAQWATAYVTAGIHTLVRRFEAGDVGQGHSQQYAQLVEMMDDYLAMPATKRRHSYKASEAVAAVQVVPLVYFTTRTRLLKAFNQSGHKTPRQVLEGLLKEMVEEEVITQMPLDQTIAQFKTRMPIYLPGPNWSGKRATR